MEFAPKTLMDSHVIALMVTMDIQIVLRVLVAVILIHPQAATRKMVNVIATKALMELFAINVPTDTLGSLTATVSGIAIHFSAVLTNDIFFSLWMRFFGFQGRFMRRWRCL